MSYVALWHECSPANLRHIFRTPFYKNTYRGLLSTKTGDIALEKFFGLHPATKYV